MALFGHGAMSDLSPLCAPKRTSADHSKFMGSRPSATASHFLSAREKKESDMLFRVNAENGLDLRP